MQWVRAVYGRNTDVPRLHPSSLANATEAGRQGVVAIDVGLCRSLISYWGGSAEFVCEIIGLKRIVDSLNKGGAGQNCNGNGGFQ